MSYFKHPTAVVESDAIGADTKIWHFVHVRKGATIGHRCVIGKSAYIDADVVIGDDVKIQNFASIYKGVTLEDFVFIGPAVVFTNDRAPRASLWDDDRLIRTTVKTGASVGANATVICGVVIGEHAMVGAGSVVTHTLPPFSLAYGNPARQHGYVCYCGEKLERIISENERSITYSCRCGETVNVVKT
jgi:UDP-2-acetamido-3-amino-2,3-dideoxy-glucuronate N-acetyltransferase